MRDILCLTLLYEPRSGPVILKAEKRLQFRIGAVASFFACVRLGEVPNCGSPIFLRLGAQTVDFCSLQNSRICLHLVLEGTFTKDIMFGNSRNYGSINVFNLHVAQLKVLEKVKMLYNRQWK